MDPHTATCIKAYEQFSDQKLHTVIYSTAEWTKFSPTVALALGKECKDDKEALLWIKESMSQSVPNVVNSLFEKPIKHNKIIQKDTIGENILTLV
jgi:threonine synthase